MQDLDIYLFSIRKPFKSVCPEGNLYNTRYSVYIESKYDSAILYYNLVQNCWDIFSGVTRAFPGGPIAYPEGQNEEEKEKTLRKNKKNLLKFEKKMNKVEVLLTRDCEAGNGPGHVVIKPLFPTPQNQCCRGLCTANE